MAGLVLEIGNFVRNVFDNLVVAAVTAMVSTIWYNRSGIYIWAQSVKRYNRPVRVSAAYLFRIKVDGKYILMKGKHIDQYQPIGGVYKISSSFDRMFYKWSIQSEPEERFHEQDDIRIKLKGKYLGKFLSWFETGKNREITVHREFIEELIDTGIVNYADLANTKFEFVKRYKSPITHSVYFDMDELHIFDTFVLNTDKETNKKLLRAVENKKLILVSENQIRKHSIIVDGRSLKIGEHSERIL